MAMTISDNPSAKRVTVTTTNRYATVDLEMKRKAIEQARPIDQATAALALWRTDASILKWLETL
jgi:integrase/recombinase XerD